MPILFFFSTNEPVTEYRVVNYTLSAKGKPSYLVAAPGFPNTDDINQTVGNVIRLHGNYLAFDATIFPGNSGGPVVDSSDR